METNGEVAGKRAFRETRRSICAAATREIKGSSTRLTADPSPLKRADAQKSSATPLRGGLDAQYGSIAAAAAGANI
jgi:hypothetical protein